MLLLQPRAFARVLLFSAGALLAASCSPPESPQQAAKDEYWRTFAEREGLNSPPLTTSGQPAPRLTVPSDSRAEYFVLEKYEMPEGRVITTQRRGPSGMSFSRRLYDCEAYTTKYLGSGDTFEQMEQSQPDPQMAAIIPGSIADYVGKEACE